MAIFKGVKNRDDHFVGGDKVDRFVFDPADLTNGDVIVGGGGRGVDTLRFTAAGAIGTSALSGVSQIERIELANGTNSLVLNDALVSTADGARVTVFGGSGEDLVYAAGLTGVNAIDVFAGGGDDVLIGGAGSDTFHFSSDALDGGDTVQGGAGSVAATDTLEIAGEVSLAADALAHITGIEAFLLSGAGMTLSLGQSIFDTAQDHRIAVTGGAGADVIDASATDANGYDGGLTVYGGDGDDVITGASQQYFSGHVFQTFVDGGAGHDTIDVSGTVLATVVYDAADIRVAAFAGTLIVDEGIHLDLTRSDDQSSGDGVIVQGFFQVDASASQEAVSIVGTGDGTLTGGAGDDYLSNAHYITGGRGADTMISNYTVFTIGLHDFAAGETIIGGGFSALNVTGSVDFRTGDVSGIRSVGIQNAPDALRPTHLTFSAEEASGFDQIFATADGPTAVVDIRADTPTILNLRYLYLGHVDLTVYGSTGDDLITLGAGTIYGYAGDDVITIGSGTIHGGRGNDVLGGYGQLYGDAGDDIITTSALGPGRVDGGDGNDTLYFTADFYTGDLTINLSHRNNQLVLDADHVAARVSGFENVDISDPEDFHYYEGVVSITGDDNANIIVGARSANKIYGLDGDDRLTGGEFDDLLIGGNGDDVLVGGNGNDKLIGGVGDDIITGGFHDQDTLIGGAGADRFRFLSSFAFGSEPHFAGSVIRDFDPEQDKLEFAPERFGVNGRAIDTLVVSDGHGSIAGADIVIDTGGRLRNGSDVEQFLDGLSTGARDHGLFVVGVDGRGHTLIFYAPSTHPQSYEIYDVADLGNIGNPADTLTLNDFSFI